MQTVRGTDRKAGRTCAPVARRVAGKKTAQIAVERDKEVKRILEKAARAKNTDLEAWEFAIRSAVLAAGAQALSGLLAEIGSGRRDEPTLCACGARMESNGVRGKPLLSILGPVAYSRSMYQCPVCGKIRYPGDEELDVKGTSRTPGLRRIMARTGGRSAFKEARDDLKSLAEIEVSAKDVERVAEAVGEDMERWSSRERKELCLADPPIRPDKTIPVLYVCCDGTGVPMVTSELKGRKGKQPDGSARTREAKLGCVFTQTAVDDNGFPVRDPDSTSFVGAVESVEPFGQRLYAEAIRRGLFNAQQVVVIGDGAKWIKGLAELHFPEAIQIIDLFHAREHVAELCKILFDADEKKAARFRWRWWTDLDEGNGEKIIEQACREQPANPALREKAQKEIAYLENNKDRMRYADYRAQGLFVGSGVVEAGCKSVIGQRLKQSGMEWSLRGANAIIALRCMIKSGRLEDYWESRCA